MKRILSLWFTPRTVAGLILVIIGSICTLSPALNMGAFALVIGILLFISGAPIGNKKDRDTAVKNDKTQT